MLEEWPGLDIPCRPRSKSVEKASLNN